MRSRGLKIKLLSLAIGAGLAICATLLLVQYLQYRETRATAGVEVERSLLTDETRRLELLASKLFETHRAPLERALIAGDLASLHRTTAAIMTHPAVVSVKVMSPDGAVAFETTRTQEWVSDL